MEELILTAPVEHPETVVPAKTISTYKVMTLTLSFEQLPNLPEQGFIDITLKDDLDGRFFHRYVGKTATDMIRQLNTANLSTKSLHKRVLEKLSADGIIPGTVSGAPDPPGMTTATMKANGTSVASGTGTAA